MNSNHCRICISVEGTIKIFFNTDGGHTISTRIMECALVKVFYNDGLPDVICEDCLQNLNIAIKFKQKCQESDNILRKMVTSNDKENNYDLNHSKTREFIVDTGESDIDRKLKCRSPVSESGTTGCDGDLSWHGDSDLVVDTGGVEVHISGTDKQLPKCKQPSEESFGKVKTKRKGVGVKRWRKSQVSKSVDNLENGISCQKENGRLYICEVCSKAYSSRRQMRRHQVTHSQQKRYTCSVCNKQFHFKANLQVHERVHTGERPFLCNNCGKSFAQVSGLQRHLTIHADEKPFECGVCAKRFKLADTLAGHLRTHTAARPYKCTSDGCDKAFTHHSALNKHMTVHTGVRKHRCTHCAKAFGRSDSLAQHLKIHTGERPFGCVSCGASFSSKSTLKMHVRTHTAEKPYPCHFCRKAFAQSSVLTRHLRTHTGERPYQCALCNANFAIKARLTEHTRTCSNHTNQHEQTVTQPSPTNIQTEPIKHNDNDNLHDNNFGKRIFIPNNMIINVDSLHVNPEFHVTQTPTTLSQEDQLRYMQLMKSNHSYYLHHSHQLS